MGKGIARSGGKKASAQGRTELSRTSHWILSRRGPYFLDPIFRLGDRSLSRIGHYIEQGHKVADIGCGWGHFSFALAGAVGPEGKVYSVDLAPKVIAKIQKRAQRGHYLNIEARQSSAADLGFIPDRSVDIIFANGLLCSMAVDRSAAVAEIKRILKPTGHAYLSLGATPPWGYVDEAEWGQILEGFLVVDGGTFKEKWAIVALKLV